MSTGENLKRLATTFTVCDIMVSTGSLKCASVDSEAVSISAEYPDFSTIPIRDGHELTRYYSRDSKQVNPIRVQDLIGDGTRLLDLVDVLAEREFAFILGPKGIVGYVHYSDLNHSLVKLAFYMLLEGVERHALDSIRHKLDDSYLRATLGETRFCQLQSKYRNSGDAGQSVVNYLNIRDILKLAFRAEPVQVDDAMAMSIKDARDGAAHVSENLVSNYAGVQKLAAVKRECLKILRVE